MPNEFKVKNGLLVSGSANINASGSEVFSVDGTSGRLFQVDDTLSGSLFSVNTAAGLPIIEAFSDNTVRIGQFGSTVFFVSQSRVGIGKVLNLNSILDVVGTLTVTGSVNVLGSVTSSNDMHVNNLTVGRGGGNQNQNTAVGDGALRFNTSGIFNTAVGAFALVSASGVGAGGNTAVGAVSMRYSTTAANNSAFGYGSLFDNTNGSNNCAFGYSALGGNTTGTYNIGIGLYAGDTLSDNVTFNTTSDNSIFIGYNTHPSQSNSQNEIVIGDQATGNGNNSITLGNTSITKTILRSGVGVGTINPTTALHAVGQLRLESYTTTTSYTGTAVGVLAFDASGNILTIATPGGGGGTVTGQLILTAGGGWPSITNGAQSPTLTATATNAVNFYSINFADAAQTFANWAMPMPSDYNGGTITAVFYWMSNNVSTNSVVWGFQGRAYADSDAIDQAFGTAQTVTDANNATRDVNISAATAAITLGGTPAASNFVQFRCYRDGAAGGDTSAAVAELLAIRITYTRA